MSKTSKVVPLIVSELHRTEWALINTRLSLWDAKIQQLQLQFEDLQKQQKALGEEINATYGITAKDSFNLQTGVITRIK